MRALRSLIAASVGGTLRESSLLERRANNSVTLVVRVEPRSSAVSIRWASRSRGSAVLGRFNCGGTLRESRTTLTIRSGRNRIGYGKIGRWNC
jgi:hypothetical protein